MHAMVPSGGDHDDVRASMWLGFPGVRGVNQPGGLGVQVGVASLFVFFRFNNHPTGDQPCLRQSGLADNVTP